MRGARYCVLYYWRHIIGAIRHGGFIPWDIDIDIAMPRDSYVRFKGICGTKLGNLFVYRDYTNTPNFEHPHALVCKKNTAIYFSYEQFDKPKENLGIYVDIFPLDNAPENQSLQQEQANQILKVNKIARIIAPKFYSASVTKKLVKKIMKLLFCRYRMDFLNKKREDIHEDILCRTNIVFMFDGKSLFLCKAVHE